MRTTTIGRESARNLGVGAARRGGMLTAKPGGGVPARRREHGPRGPRQRRAAPVPAAPLGADPLARDSLHRVVEPLRRAVQIARRGRPDDLRALCEELLETHGRLEAWMLAHPGAAPDAPPGPEASASRITCTALSAGKEPLGEWLLIPFGVVRLDRPVAGEDFEFTRRHAETLAAWFDSLGRKLAIDYEHQSFGDLNTRPDGLRPAAGWIGRLEVRDDGLWAADVTWTQRARELLRAGEYRYFSPVIYWSDELRSGIAGLGPVALTNDPAMRGVSALAAQRRRSEKDAAASPCADDTQIRGPGPCGAAPDEDGGPQGPRSTVMERNDGDGAMNRAAPDAPGEPADVGARVAVLIEQVELLTRRMKAQQADGFVERGLRLGKILDSTSMDWRDDYLRDPSAAEARLRRAPVVLPQGRTVAAADSSRSGRDGPGRPPLPDGGVSIEAADLEAFERACGAGRVILK